jgi:hypothetical protein
VLSLSADLRDPARVELVPEFLPIVIGTDHLPHLAHGEQRDAVLAALRQCCTELAQPQRVRARWRRKSMEETRRLLYAIYLHALRGRPGEALRTLIRALRRAESRRWLAGCVSGGFF